MTENSVDRILDIIDTGLQTPAPDPSFGEVSPPNVEGCARCGAPPADEGGDFCAGCRAFLLGDTDTDPATGVPEGWSITPPAFTPPGAGCRCAVCTGEFARQILDGLRGEAAAYVVADEQYQSAAAEAGAAAMADWLARADNELAATVGRPAPDRVPEFTCLACQPGRPCDNHNSDALDALLFAARSYGTRYRPETTGRVPSTVFRRSTGEQWRDPTVYPLQRGDLITYDGQQYTVTRITDGVYGPVVDLAPAGPQGILPPARTDPETPDRAEERRLLDRWRRGHRRTNRW